MLITLFNGPVAWQSNKQKTVMTSTAEAELLSLSHTARESIALINLFTQIRFNIDRKPSVWCDNKLTVGLIQKERPELTTKLRHADMYHSWLRQAYQMQSIDVQWALTDQMAADGLTKALGPQPHARFLIPIRHSTAVACSLAPKAS